MPRGRLGSGGDESFKHFYADRDGEATSESVKATNSTIRSIATVIVGMTVGAISLSQATVTKIYLHSAWLQFGISVRIDDSYT